MYCVFSIRIVTESYYGINNDFMNFKFIGIYSTVENAIEKIKKLDEYATYSESTREIINNNRQRYNHNDFVIEEVYIDDM